MARDGGAKEHLSAMIPRQRLQLHRGSTGSGLFLSEGYRRSGMTALRLGADNEAPRPIALTQTLTAFETDMIPLLITPRLVLRPLALDDAPAIQALFPRWEIVRYLARAPWPYPPDGALSYVRDVALPAMHRGVEWHWSLRPSDKPETLVGVVNLMDKEGDNRGCWLDPAWQGRGLMTEAVERVTEYWFVTLGRSVLRVPKASENLPSRRLSERTGMRLVEQTERDYVSGRMAADIWEITQDEWRGQRGRRELGP